MPVKTPEEIAEAQGPAMAFFVVSFLCLCVLIAESVDEKGPFSFSFERFEKDRRFGFQIALYGDAEVRNSTVSLFGKGRMMYKTPVRFFGTNPGFSTNFSFSISAAHDEGLAFLLVPNNPSLISANGSSPRFLAVKFGSRVAIDVGGGISVEGSNLSGVDQKLRSWIDYDGASKMVEVRVGKSADSRPEKPLTSCPVDLSNTLWREAMYVGISSSRNGTVYSWGFGVNHGAPYLMHSEPLDPELVSVRAHEEPPVRAGRGSPWRTLVALLVGAVCGAFVASAVFILRLNVVGRHPIAPVEYPVICMESEKMALDGSTAGR